MRTLTCAFGAFALITATALPVLAEPTQATILIGGRVVPFQVKPFVGPDGQVRAPVDAVQLLGAKFQRQTDGTVLITSAAGRRFSSPFTAVDGRMCVPFARVAQALGGTADWQPTTATLTVRARLQVVRQDDKSLTIYTSYPVYYTVKRIDNPERLYVDLYGLDLATTPASIPSQSGGVTQIRSGQIDYQTVRITIDLKQGMPFRVESGVQSSEVKVALGDGAEPEVAASLPPAAPLAPLPVSPPPRVVVNPPPPRLPLNAGPVTITNVTYKIVSPALTQVLVSTTGPAKYRTETLDSPNRLAFDLAGAVPESSVQAAQAVGSPFIKAIRVGRLLTSQMNFGRVVLDLSHAVGFTVDSQPVGSGMTYTINVLTGGTGTPAAPLVSEGPTPPLNPLSTSLAGKIICIDPGHGGKDSGARDEFRTGKVFEKDITLSVGRRLRDLLTQNGATVVMTRSDDTFIPVMGRPQIANDRHADFFISIHADSSGGQNSHTGTTIYYHAQNPVCKLMAADISRRVAEVSGIPRLGTRSDTVRFPTGFGVLRGSLMPAVLVETGYMNCDSDLATLRTDDAQQKIAEGIVAGLRDFMQDRANQARSASRDETSPRKAF